MILRKTGEEYFEVVGECYLYGIMDGESILGPLPTSWQVQPHSGIEGSVFEMRFKNMNTDVDFQEEDPRLGSLPEDWERVSHDRTTDEPVVVAIFRNKSTGDIMNSDPRMLPDALKARGVNLEKFKLI